MPYLVDTNVLLRLLQRGDSYHQAIRVVSLDSVDGSKCSFDAHLARCRVQHAVPQQLSTMEKGMFAARQGRRRSK